MIKAYSYKRFSTPEQAKGDSLRRQTELADKYAQKHNLKLDNELILHDLGISGFRSANATDGMLGAFLEKVRLGEVHRGSYLLIENMDRLSRDKIQVALRLFLSILQAGIVIVTLSDERVYKDEKLDLNDLLISLSNMSRAHEESLRKSYLKTHSWEQKIKNAASKTVTKNVPAWLLVNSHGQIEVIQNRVDTIRLIFKMTIEGYGQRLILKELDKRGLEPFGFTPSIKRDKRHPKGWYTSRVNRILTDRSVLGEYHPRKSRGGTGIIKDYYPRIISDEEFYLAEAARKARALTKFAGRKGDNLSNLFSGLLKCGYSQTYKGIYSCAGTNVPMSVVNKGPKSKTRYIQCARQKEGNKGCEKCIKYWRYDEFEKVFLEHISNIDLDVLFDNKEKILSKTETLLLQRSSLEGELAHCNNQISKLVELISNLDNPPKSLVSQILKYETEIEKIQLDLHRVEQDLAVLIDEEKNQAEIRSEATHLLRQGNKTADLDFDQRIKLSKIIRDRIETLELFPLGMLPSDNAKKNFLELMGSEYEERYDKYMNEISENQQKAIIVKYRSGEIRVIFYKDEGTFIAGNLSSFSPKGIWSSYKFECDTN